jgi:hypothetical protein
MKTMAVKRSAKPTNGKTWTMAMIHELKRQERRRISRESVTLPYRQCTCGQFLEMKDATTEPLTYPVLFIVLALS